jgi:acetylglutamate kinase
VITSPKNILYELFTVKGKGTLLKYHELAVENDFSKIDEEKLKETIEDAFKKKLKSGYFSQNITQVIYEKSFGGLAMFTKMGEFDYLDKFAVKKEFQGTGLGKSIWLEIKKNHPSFVWRANPKNPINAFYLKNCDGFKKCGAWNVYWNGLSLNDVAKAVLFTVQKKPSFIEVEK